MKKYSLILSEKHFTSFHSTYFHELFSEYFDIKFIERTNNIDPKTCFPVVDCMDIVSKKKIWCEYLKVQGYHIFIDTLWCLGDYSDENSYNISNANWFWYHESLLYSQLGYNQYQPNKSYKKLGLMPMGLIKCHFDILYEKMIPYLEDFYYSYIERLGKYLPNDADPLFPPSPGSTGQQQRYFNPIWYDDTYFSLVAETTTDLSNGRHVTEKSFKPISYYHPFIIWGQPGTLEFLKNLGFETFPTIFDESYDQIEDHILRLDKIIDNVKNFKRQEYDSLTLEKLAHNHDLFYNKKIIKDRILKEIIYPMIEWIETKL